MNEPTFSHKSTVEEIRERFDHDVERFSNLDTGQSAAMDSPLHLELLSAAAHGVNPTAEHVLDLGCGAGNYTLKLLSRFGAECPSHVTLVDLSQPMLDRAVERLAEAYPHVSVNAVQADVREFDFGVMRFDIVMAAQCLHHLRQAAEWQAVFTAVFRGLRPGGSFWVADSLSYHRPEVAAIIRQRWSDYLEDFKGADYRDHVLEYVEKEDSPRPLGWQLEQLRAVGFVDLDVLHVNGRFGSFGGRKPESGADRL